MWNINCNINNISSVDFGGYLLKTGIVSALKEKIIEVWGRKFFWRFDVSCGIGFTNCTKEAPCNEVKETGKGQALRVFVPHNLDRFPYLH
jgi:hypothetical protein